MICGDGTDTGGGGSGGGGGISISASDGCNRCGMLLVVSGFSVITILSRNSTFTVKRRVN